MNIIEFASAIGVSTATVSRAMNNRGRISEKTRRYILEKASELDYVPNVSAQQLVTRRNRVIGLEHPANPDMLSDFYMVELAQGIQVALQAEGYDLMLHLAAGRQTKPHWSRGNRVEGLIVVLSWETPGEIERLKKQWRAPAVFIGHEKCFSGDTDCRVLLDLECGLRQAMQHLLSLGHRRIAFLGSLARCRVREMWRGMMSEYGLPVPDGYDTIAGTTIGEARRGTETLLALTEPPTAILSRTDVLASGAIHALRHNGIRVPDDVAVIGHDDIALAELCDPPLTTIRIDKRRAGTLAARLLFEQLKCPGSPPQSATISSCLVVRDSCGGRSGEMWKGGTIVLPDSESNSATGAKSPGKEK